MNNNNIEIKILLLNCKIIISGEEILIGCPSKSKFFQICKQQHYIAAMMLRKYPRCTQITIAVDNGRQRVNLPIMSQQLIIPTFRGTSQQDLIKEALSYEGACGIIRMSDHKGLFSNTNIVLSSNAHPNDWLGKKMSDWWIPSELETYLERLSKDQELRGYSYVAKMMDGQNARLTVDARLVTWNGDLCRMVKTVSRELLA